MKERVTESGLAFYESGPKDAPVIVLGHALGADSRIWDEVVGQLEDQWRVLRWDQPGHGKSKLPNGPAQMETVVAQLKESLDELGVTSAHVGGLSLGGMVSMAAAADDPERFTSLSVLDAGPALLPASDWHARADLVRKKGMAPLVEPTMDRWFAPESRVGEREGSYQRTREAFLNCDPDGYAYCCEVIASTDLSEHLADLELPTLILTGEEDPAMLPEKAAQLAEAIPGAGAPVVIPGARHITSTHAPQEVAQAIATVAEDAL